MRLNCSRRGTVALLLVLTMAMGACQPTPSVPGIPGSSGAAAPAGEFRIARVNADQSAVRWNPCQPIRYVVRLDHSPSFVGAELQRSITAIESASGLDLVYGGTTTEAPHGNRPARDPARYGAGWAPILISFATASEVPFGSPTASGWGQAVSATDPTSGAQQYVTGQVVLRPGGWTEGTTSANPLSLMLQHELGHVVGLAHVGSGLEIMGTGGNGTARTWGPGDLAGLAAVGRSAGCLPVVP